MDGCGGGYHFDGRTGGRAQRMEPGTPKSSRGTFHRHNRRSMHLQQFASATVEAPGGVHRAIVQFGSNHSECLLGQQVSSDERRNAASTAVERVVAAPHPLGFGDVVGDGGGHIGAGRSGGRLDADGLRGATRQRIAQHLVGAGRSDGDGGDTGAGLFGLPQRELQRRLIGGRHAREPFVVRLARMADPLEAGDDGHACLTCDGRRHRGRPRGSAN
jgi:hypothetical protein